MAHYAELDKNNIVLRVVVMDNALSNQECLEWLSQNISKSKWVQTSYNGNIRHKYARAGDTYNEKLDVFVPPQPHSSWIYNVETFEWESLIEPPVLKESERAIWNESQNQWDILLDG